jgi:hypothetical protein
MWIRLPLLLDLLSKLILSWITWSALYTQYTNRLLHLILCSSEYFFRLIKVQRCHSHLLGLEFLVFRLGIFNESKTNRPIGCTGTTNSLQIIPHPQSLHPCFQTHRNDPNIGSRRWYRESISAKQKVSAVFCAERGAGGHSRGVSRPLPNGWKKKALRKPLVELKREMRKRIQDMQLLSGAR